MQGQWYCLITATLALLIQAPASGKQEEVPRITPRSTHSSPSKETAEIDRLLKQHRYAAAESLGRHWLLQAVTESGDSSLEAAQALDVLVDVLVCKKEGIDPEVRSLAARAVALKESLFGADHPEVARSLHNLGSALLNAADYRGARAAHERALQIREKSLAPWHPRVANSLDLVLEAILRGGFLPPESVTRHEPHLLALAQRALQIKERAYGPDHPEVARSLHTLASLLHDAGDLASAKSIHERALSIRERSLGPDHLDVARSLDLLSVMWHESGDEHRSVECDQRALSIRAKTLGPEHAEYARNLDELAVGYEILDRYAEAQEMHERALRIREKRLGTAHPEYIHNLINVANTLSARGDFAGAAPIYERAMESAEVRLEPTEALYAFMRYKYADFLSETGSYQSAARHFEAALTGLEKAFGPDFYPLGGALTSYGVLQQRRGDLPRARALLERALAIFEKTLGIHHRAVAYPSRVLAQVLLGMSDAEGARRFAERSVDILESTGEDKYFLALCLDTLGAIYHSEGDNGMALQLLDRALTIKRDVVGPAHPEVAVTLTQVAAALRSRGDARGALQTALEAERIGREHLAGTARLLPERQALRYASVRKFGLDLALSVASEIQDADATRKAWDALVRGRAVILDEMAHRHRTVGRSSDPEVARLADEVSRARARIANIALRGPGESGAGPYLKLIEDATRRKEQAERALARKSLDSGDEDAGPVGPEDVAKAMPADTALVAYVRYRHYGSVPAGPDQLAAGTHDKPAKERQEPSAYLAFVLQPGGRDPQLIRLGAAARIDALIRRWRDSFASPPRGSRGARLRAEARYTQIGMLLAGAVWRPLMSLIGQTERIIIVPDGMLNLVNLAALPLDSNGYVVETKALHYISAERDIARSEGPEAGGGGILIVGGPDFNAAPTDVASGARIRQDGANDIATMSAAATSNFYRGPTSRCEDFQSLQFAPLPAAVAEADEIAAQWVRLPAGEREARGQVVKLTGARAGEFSFKRLASGMRVIHVATHGFFMPGDCSSSPKSGPERPGSPSLSTDRIAQTSPDNSLLLTGLALAAANHRHTIRPDGELEDGILTAEEIASLDLSRVEWVVLSACETALGDLQDGEGVLGLRRAIRVAGARTGIMSLWSVQDEATREWMVALYRSRLAGSTTAESVRNAALGILENRRTAGKSTHPFYWGAFVAAGDWN